MATRMSSARDIAEIAAAAVVVGSIATAGFLHTALQPTSQLFGRALTAPRKPEEIALTFDDGPNPSWTPQLLDVLARYNVRATFFLIGQYAATQRALVRQTYEAGHLIGNHTWTHPNLFRTNRQDTHKELDDTNNELQQIIGARVRFFRPPYGLRRPATLTIARSLGLIPVTWNAIGNDWNARSSEAIFTRSTSLITKNQRNGWATNLVLHDGGSHEPAADRSRTIAATERLLEQYAQARRFVTLDAWEAGWDS